MSEYALVGLVDAEVALEHITIPLGSMVPASVVPYEGELCVAISADPLTGTESGILADTSLPTEAKLFGDLNAAIVFGSMLHAMDKRMWPPFNPVVGEVCNGRLVALVLPPEAEKGDRLVRTAALRYGLQVTRLADV